MIHLAANFGNRWGRSLPTKTRSHVCTIRHVECAISRVKFKRTSVWVAFLFKARAQLIVVSKQCNVAYFVDITKNYIDELSDFIAHKARLRAFFGPNRLFDISELHRPKNKGLN